MKKILTLNIKQAASDCSYNKDDSFCTCEEIPSGFLGRLCTLSKEGETCPKFSRASRNKPSSMQSTRKKGKVVTYLVTKRRGK